MNVLFFLISLFFTNKALSDVIVTVTHVNPVTVTYDPVLGRIIPPSPSYDSEGNDIKADEATGEVETNNVNVDDRDGKVNAKATSSLTKIKSSLKSTGLSKTASTFSTGATTDASSAFRMSLPFAFGTVAAIILAAIVF